MTLRAPEQRGCLAADKQETRCLLAPEMLHLLEPESWTCCLFLKVGIAKVSVSMFSLVLGAALTTAWKTEIRHKRKSRGGIQNTLGSQVCPCFLALQTNISESSEKRCWSSSGTMCPWKVSHIPSLHLQHSQFYQNKVIWRAGKGILSYSVSQWCQSPEETQNCRAPFLSHSLISIRICTPANPPSSTTLPNYMYPPLSPSGIHSSANSSFFLTSCLIFPALPTLTPSPYPVGISSGGSFLFYQAR